MNIVQVRISDKAALEAKKRMLKFRYGITYDEYLKMYSNQKQSCAICEEPYALGGRKGLYVDHCHETKVVRGLLCPTCNSGIGKLKESRELFEKALAYLDK